MTTINLGSIAMVFKGAYSAATQYSKNNTVTYQGSTYIALQNTLGNAPTNITYWAVVATGSNQTTTLGDIIIHGDTGAERLPAGNVGDQLVVASDGKPAWNASYSTSRSFSALNSVAPFISSANEYPWLIDSGSSYYPHSSLPNPACGPVKRPSARLNGGTAFVYLNDNNEAVMRGNDASMQYLGVKSTGITLGSRIMNNFSAVNGLMKAGDYFISLHCAGDAILALTKLGDVFAIGEGAYGILGQDATTNLYMWTKIPFIGPDSTYGGLSAAIVSLHIGQGAGETSSATTASKTVHAIDVNGRVFAWGQNGLGQLGIGNSTATIAKPTLIAGNSGFITADPLNKVRQISGSGYHTLLVDNLGNVYTCGDNSYGQLGIGTTTNTAANYSFVYIPALADIYQVEAVEMNYFSTIWTTAGRFSLALKKNGTLYGTGKNTTGQLGLGNTTDQSSFQPAIGSFSSVYTISSGEFASCAALGGTPLVPNNTLYTWGYNAGGQCGVGNATTPVTTPAVPSSTSQNTNQQVVAIDGVLNTTPLSFPNTNISIVLPCCGFTTPGGCWFLLSGNSNLWFFGDGSAGFNIVGATISTLTSNQLPQKWPSPWNAIDGWSGSQAVTINDFFLNGDTKLGDSAIVVETSDGRLFQLGGNTNSRFHDDARFSYMFRQITN